MIIVIDCIMLAILVLVGLLIRWFRVRVATSSIIDPLSGTDQQRRPMECPYQSLDVLLFNESKERHAELFHLKKFPEGHQVKRFRLVTSAYEIKSLQ